MSSISMCWANFSPGSRCQPREPCSARSKAAARRDGGIRSHPGGVLAESVWWQLPSSPDRAGSPPSEREWEAAVNAQLREAVQRQLISDVPLGAFLSAGVHSSLVAAAPTLGPTRWRALTVKDPRHSR